MKRKVAIVGLDGASWSILDSLMQAGKLPFLSLVKQKSRFGVCRSVVPSLTAPAWVTFQTGVNPGRHGVFDFFDYNSEGRQLGIVDSQSIQAETVYETLDANNKKGAFLNLPVSYPLKPTTSVVVSSFLTPSNKKYVLDPVVLQHLRQMNYEIDVDITREGTLNKERIFQDLFRVSSKRTEAATWLLNYDDWDVFFVLYKSLDVAQHVFWDEEALTRFVIHIDSQVKELTESIYDCMGKDTQVIFLSDHGFGKVAEIEFRIYAWVRQVLGQKQPQLQAYLQPLRLMKHRLAHSMNRISRKGANDTGQLQAFSRNDDWEKLHASLGVVPAWFGVNVKDKMLQKKFLSEARKLSYKGKKVFKICEEARTIYSGSYVDHAPDLVLMTDPYFQTNTEPYAVKIFGKHTSHLTGEHFSTPEGIYMLLGEDFELRSGELSLTDFVPAVMRYLGCTRLPKYEQKSSLSMKHEHSPDEVNQVEI